MTIDEVEQTLPNGFHDARLFSVMVDYGRAQCKLVLEVDFDEDERKVELLLSCLSYCIMEVPDSSYPFILSDSPKRVSGDETTIEILPTLDALRGKAPEGTFFYSFFVNSCNCFIHFAATRAELRWV